MTFIMILVVYYNASVALTTIGPFATREDCQNEAFWIKRAYKNEVTSAEAMCVMVVK